MSQIRNSTIRAIAPGGQWNGMDKHLVTMADGVQYVFYYKEGTPFPKKLNEEVSFVVTNATHNSAKFENGASNNGNYNYKNNGQRNYAPKTESSSNVSSKDELIVRQTVIKSAAELHARSGNIDLVLQDAENMFNWIYRK